VVDLFPSAGTGEGSEERQIAAISLDSVQRGIALTQVAKEVGDSFPDCGPAFGGGSHLAFALG